MTTTLDSPPRPDPAGQDDPRPLGGYAVLLGVYSTGVTAAAWWLRRKRAKPAPFSLMDLLLYGLATEHLSRLISKDSVMSVLRKPFTEFEEPAGEGEVNERVEGTGLRHAVGELIACPFCIGQWVATALIAGRMAAPELTTAVVSVAATARTSDYLQLLYSMARKEA